MLLKKLILFSIVFILLFVSIGSAVASDNLNNESILNSNECIGVEGEVLEVNSQGIEKINDSPKTIHVYPDSRIPNQVLVPTVQPAIDNASAGDTIILHGNFIHCHFVVNKPLIIKADSTATIDPCPHHNNPLGSGRFGIFYLTPEASGTVLEGFNFINNNYILADQPQNPFAIFIDGAENVTIKDCIINWNLNESFLYDGIILKDAKNIGLSNIYLNNTKRGIVIENSSYVTISDSKIENGRTSGVNVCEGSKDIYIINNELYSNGYSGINLTSAESIHIINNVIKNNGITNDYDTGSGVYVNANVSDSEIKGNLMIGNALHAVMLDYRVRNMGTASGDENLLIIENNYFNGHRDMVLHRRIFVKTSSGEYGYDSANDVYYKQIGGDYIDSKAVFYMKNAFVVNEMICGFTYYNPDSSWGKGNYLLNFSLNQVKKGVYNLSFVDKDGFVADDLSSFDVIFYLNNLSGICKTVHIQNGTAIADFTDNASNYFETNNSILVVLPENDPIKFDVKDFDIPTSVVVTKISAAKLTTYPLSDAYFKARLTDDKGNFLENQTVTIKINGKTYRLTTNKNGLVQVKVSLTAKKTYAATIIYNGSEQYASSQATASIVVKTGSKKSVIKASNLKVKRNSKKTFSFKLTNSAGKALSYQKVTVNVNGKTYNLKTSKNGVAKLSIKFSKVKKYSVSIKFLGNDVYKPVSKTSAVIVTKK